jgi:hypothetical protein
VASPPSPAACSPATQALAGARERDETPDRPRPASSRPPGIDLPQLQLAAVRRAPMGYGHACLLGGNQARVRRGRRRLRLVPSGRGRDAGADARLWEAMREYAGARGSALVDHVRRQVLAGEPDRARIARGPAPKPSMRLPCLSRVSADWARSPEST